MKKENGQKLAMKYKIAIPSRGRPEIACKHPMLKAEGIAYLVVPEAEVEDYGKLCGNAIDIIGSPNSLRGISQKRGWMVDNLWEKDEDFFFMVDDDLLSIEYLWTKHMKREYDPAYMIEIIEHTANCCLDAGASIFGWAHSAIPFERMSHAPFQLRGWISGHAIGIADRKIKYDKHITAKEDLDLSLQVLSGPNRIIWLDRRWHWRCDAWSTKGGQAAWRTTETEKKDLKYIADKWGSGIITRRHSRKTGQGLQLHID